MQVSACQKSGSPTTFDAPGEIITYKYTVINTGSVTLTDVNVSDSHPGLEQLDCVPISPAMLAPGASMTCTATYVTTQRDVDTGSILNLAIAFGTGPNGSTVDSNEATFTVTAVQSPSISLAKSASPTTVTAAGQTINFYTYAVTNTGNVTLNAVTVSDPHSGLSMLTCTPSNPATLMPGASMTCTATYMATQADIDTGSIMNTATASGQPPQGSLVTATSSFTVTVVQTPALSLTKSASPATFSKVGQVITYSYLVTNTGNVTFNPVTVTDPHPGLSTISCQSTTLAPGASMTCTATYTTTQADIEAGSITNTGTATGTPPVGSVVTATSSATVVAPIPAISLTKSASPSTFSKAVKSSPILIW